MSILIIMIWYEYERWNLESIWDIEETVHWWAREVDYLRIWRTFDILMNKSARMYSFAWMRAFISWKYIFIESSTSIESERNSSSRDFRILTFRVEWVTSCDFFWILADFMVLSLINARVARFEIESFFESMMIFSNDKWRQ